jgi:hypothetical protein
MMVIGLLSVAQRRILLARENARSVDEVSNDSDNVAR